MPWLLGIDEAGYGPNLGPFVMSSALFSLPEGCSTDLWKVLRLAVRKAHHKADGRLVVDDSKQVYSPKIGLGVLEKNLWPFIQLNHGSVGCLNDFWQQVCLHARETVDHEPYLCWDETFLLSLPSVSSMALLGGVMQKSGVKLERLQSSIIPPRHFNHLTRAADSKAAVPLHSIGHLVAALPKDDEVHIHIDRLGGRQYYTEQVAKWFPDQEVCIEIETPNLSHYRVGKRITICFQVEADQHSFPVALASMLSKYWREVLMMQFNRWFAQEQSGITPTAGYPGDAERFWTEVEPTRKRLGLRNDDWWRER